VFLLTALAASAQLGSPYPYPRGGGRGPGLPIPRRGGKQSKTPPEQQKVLPNFPGMLKRMDAKTIVLELDDYRVLEFRRNDKTKFLKNGEPIQPAEFKVGDRIAIEGSEDAEAFLTAVNVHWEKAGTGDKAKQSADSPTEEQIAAAEREQAKLAAQEPATQVKPAPAPRDADDPGPPKLQRGKPVTRRVSPAQRDEEPVQTAAAAGPPAVPPPARAAAVATTVERIDESQPIREGDAVIRKAQETALEFTETLPNYVCQEIIARYYSDSPKANWQAIDVVRTEVVYENGKEDYRNITINGKAVKKGMEELSGSWSTGEFGTVLVDLFSPATNADFRFRRNSRASGIDARMYDFFVERENSHWLIRSGSQSFQPGYKGSVWVDPKTARVLRIEMQARNLPEEFPLDKVESATDYEYVRLAATSQFLLPVHAETLSCQRGSSRCSRNTIDFRNYHKYAGESNIQFGEPKK
jgi:hypothetical protein